MAVKDEETCCLEKMAELYHLPFHPIFMLFPPYESMITVFFLVGSILQLELLFDVPRIVKT